MGHNIILNYFKFSKISNEIIFEELINREINYKNSKSYYNSIDYSQKAPLKNLNIIIDPSPHRKKYTIIKQFPILSIYIPWKYGLQLDPAEIKRLEYFTQVALNRGYNKFILQMIFVKNKNKYQLSLKNNQILQYHITNQIKSFLNLSLMDKIMLFKNEVIMKSELSDITTTYGGFFLIATTVVDDRYNL
jgi:hypothetical protein